MGSEHWWTMYWTVEPSCDRGALDPKVSDVSSIPVDPPEKTGNQPKPPGAGDLRRLPKLGNLTNACVDIV